MLLIGIDDAGRGPLIGPMVLTGVLIDSGDEKKLRDLGAKDSKLLTHPQRVALAGKINSEIIAKEVVLASPEEIDDFVLSGKNLNTLEAWKMAHVINKLNNKKDKITVIVDCPSVNTVSWQAKLESFIEHKNNLVIKCEHKADFNHPVVSAASIIAKVEREEQVAAIKAKYGDIGSGYPSDPVTKEFLKTNGKKLENSGIFRKSWATWQAVFPSKNQKLTDY